MIHIFFSSSNELRFTTKIKIINMYTYINKRTIKADK